MSRRLLLMDKMKLRERSTAQVLLDGLIIYSQDLGDLGKQLERLLRQGGVRSTLDPVFSCRLQ